MRVFCAGEIGGEFVSKSYWAKKPYRDKHTPTVAEHCEEVCVTAESILDQLAGDLSSALNVDAITLADLRRLLRAAALVHDIAKLNSAFQAMLLAKPGDTRRQPVRHEIMVSWLLADPDFYGGWFPRLGPEEEIWPVIWAVAGHHLKMGDPVHGTALFNTGSGTSKVSIPLTEPFVSELLHRAAASIGNAVDPPVISDQHFDTADDEDDGLQPRINRFAEISCLAWNRLRRNPEVQRRTALLKALLIAADVAGSALTADGQQPANWVPRELAVRITSEALDPIIVKGTKHKGPLPFQIAVGKSDKLATIVIAGCGNGKTTAAYLWAQRHASGHKLWFTYPTTGTASAGFQGYLYDHPDLLSDLIHGRSEVDLQAMRGTSEDNADDDPLRLESLRAWSQQAIICTVDTVLGLLQNQRRPLFSFPAIAAGAFVFDEIHSYDARLFGALLRFLQMFPGVPVLLMSASIPPNRMAALRDVLTNRVGEEIRGDPKLEGYQRYVIEPRASAEACRAEVVKALHYGNKVLWVCNTVAEAVTQAREAQSWAGIAPHKIIVYHSRFRYRDRVNRQKDVVAEFEYHLEADKKGRRVKPGASLVFATQVCEMSLDISADLLVTAECPLPSLVQRLGRLNRYAAGDDPWPCFVYPFQGDPYNEKPELIQTRGDYRAKMMAARDAVRDFAGRPCRQSDLAKRLDKMADVEQFEKYSAWLDDGWLTEPAQLRDGDGSVTLIREEDLAEIEDELGPERAKPSKWTSRSLVPWTIPMLSRREFWTEHRAGGYPVAPNGTVAYSMKEGATWQTNKK
jgi:CRISPR-associated endonuclease/helicase Cas3